MANAVSGLSLESPLDCMNLETERSIVESRFHLYKPESGELRLRSGETLPEFRLAYETHGTLNADKSNAILLFHALSGSQHIKGFTPSVPGAEHLWTEECQGGWWEDFIGPGKGIDTNKFFVVCANYLGGCYGTTGPGSTDPRTGKPYGRSFPHVKIADIAESQARLLDHLGVDRVHAVVGGSVGGLLCLSFATLFPERVRHVISMASSMKTSALQRLTILEQIYAIESDPNFRKGDYYGSTPPNDGMALARMIAHKTFVSLTTLEQRATTELRQPDDCFSWYQIESPIESYMLHQGRKFVKRFDANTYLRTLEAWQRFDPLAEAGVETHEALFRRCRHQNWMVFSINSDVCFYPEEQSEMVEALTRYHVPALHITVHSDKGHDSFLLDPELFTPHLAFTLAQP